MGTTGIADEMIRFNRYPYLESEELDYSVPGARIFHEGEGRSSSLTG